MSNKLLGPTKVRDSGCRSYFLFKKLMIHLPTLPSRSPPFYFISFNFMLILARHIHFLLKLSRNEHVNAHVQKLF